nr:hypothetical protein [Tanacetum cinerariifolium]
NAVQNQGIQNVKNKNGLSVILGIANQYGNGNVVAARAEGACEETERDNANCTLENNLQQASTSGTQTYKALVYDTDGSAEVFEQKDTTHGPSTNTKFAKQSTLGKPPSSRPKLYTVTPLPKSKAIPKIDESHALINLFKAFRIDNFVPNKHVKPSVRTKLITVLQPHVIIKNDVNSKTNGFSPKDIKSTTRNRRPLPRNNPKNDNVPSKSKSSQLSNNLEKIEKNQRNLQSSSNKKHMSSECNDIKLTRMLNLKLFVLCKQKENVSNQKKHKAQVWKSKNVGSNERLASSKPGTPRSCLRWSLTGRLFDLKGKINEKSESECQSDYFKGDNACTSNP